MPELPEFHYIFDPFRVGAIQESDGPCDCCGRKTGYLCDPPHTAKPVEGVCPWCVASGEAAARFEGFFHEFEFDAESPPPAVVEELTRRTPNFPTWQDQAWPVCCNDAGQFLGYADNPELKWALEEAREAFQQANASDISEFHGSYLMVFRCLHCKRVEVRLDLD